MKSVVLFSGGLDSFAALLLARESSEVVVAVHAQYGQPHGAQEFEAARALRGDTPMHLLTLPAIPTMGDIFQARNPILLSHAASVAASVGASAIWAGFCMADAEAFPDCRPRFLAAQEKALELALGQHMTITAPLLFTSKAETFDILIKRGRLEEALHATHTCYRGDRTTQYWGRGCGECSACVTRAAGWEEYNRARS